MGFRSLSPDAPKGKIKTLKVLRGYLHPYRWQVVAASIAVLIASLLVLGLGQGVRLLVDQGFATNDKALLDKAALFLVGLVILLSVASFARYYLVSWIGERVITDMRCEVFAKLLEFSPSFYEKNRTGELATRLTTDTTLIQTVVSSAIPIAIRNSVLLIGGLGLLVHSSPKLAAIVFLGVPLVLLPIIFFGRRVRQLSRTAQDKLADAGAYLQESLEGIRTIQAFTHESLDKQHFNTAVSTAFNAAIKRNRTRGILSATVISFVFGAIVLILWIGGKDVINGTITPGELVSFLFYALLVAGAASAISDILGDMQKAAGAAGRMLELLAQPPAIISPPSALPIPVEEKGSTVQFDSVCFAYPLAPETPVLQECSFSIKAGEFVAFVGTSGAGKSTLFQLLLRFYDVQKGTIRIGDIPLPQADLSSLRQAVAIVPQEPFIFVASIQENIAYGNPHATTEAIIAAAKAAGAYEFIKKMPQGLQTILGEKGIQLSGGQKQRLAVARAFLRQPAILLLDEATASLDSLSEHHIQKALQQRRGTCTILAIAHRLATVQFADRIIVLENGTIAATGTHSELLEKSDLYKKLATAQFLHTSA